MPLTLALEVLDRQFPDSPVLEMESIHSLSQRYSIDDSIPGTRGRGGLSNDGISEIENQRDVRLAERGKYNEAEMLIAEVIGKVTHTKTVS